MTAEQYDEQPPEPIRISSGPSNVTGPPVVAFYLDERYDDGEVLWARRPKIARLVAAVRVVESADAQREAGNELQALAALEGVLGEVLEPESHAYLERRWNDPEDDLDLDVAGDVVTHLMGLWFARPIGRSRGSSPPRPTPRSGTRSTVRPPSQG